MYLSKDTAMADPTTPHQDKENDMPIFCDECQTAITAIALRNDESDVLHQTGQTLLRSVERRCPICVRLYMECAERGYDFSDPQVMDDLTIEYESRPASPTLFCGISLYFYTEELDIVRMGLAFDPSGMDWSHREPPGGWAELLQHVADAPNSLSSSDTGSQAVGNLAGWWYQSCLKMHNCDWDRNETYIPPRLLVINGDMCKLVETGGKQLEGPYATLSYRWGENSSHLTLTSTTLSQLTNGMKINDLPKTFDHAMTTISRLGISYLWIDSLCILQSGLGHKEDWQEHVKLMASIYRNCILNISAADAPNAFGGCFFTRDPLLATPIVNSWRQLTQNLGDFDGEVPLEGPNVLVHLGWPTTAREFFLSRRGWVFQERMLAPRTLYFTKTQIFWECSKLGLCCETYPGGFIGAQSQFDKGYDRYPFRWEPQDIKSSFRDPYFQRWKEIIQDFNSSELSMPEDKFPAIAGVASRLDEHLKDDYVAGFFKSHLPRALLWTLLHPRGQRFKGPYRAPSWSWAATNGPMEMKFIKEPEDEIAAVQSFYLDLVNKSDRFGQLKFASITLKAPTFIVTWDCGPTKFLDLCYEFYQLPALSKPECISSVNLMFDDGLLPAEYNKALLVAVVNGHFNNVEGLILVLMKSGGLEPECYVRIGTFDAKLASPSWIEQEGVTIRDVVIN